MGDAARPIVLGLAAGAAGALRRGARRCAACCSKWNLRRPGRSRSCRRTLLVAGLAAAMMAALPIRRIDPIEALKTES